MAISKNTSLIQSPSLSPVFPSDADVEAWNALSPAEKRAIVEAEEAAGAGSGAAPAESVDDRLARVRATAKRAV